MLANLSISNVTFSSKIYDKLDDFDFYNVNFYFIDGDVPRRTSNGVYERVYLNIFVLLEHRFM